MCLLLRFLLLAIARFGAVPARQHAAPRPRRLHDRCRSAQRDGAVDVHHLLVAGQQTVLHLVHLRPVEVLPHRHGRRLRAPQPRSAVASEGHPLAVAEVPLDALLERLGRRPFALLLLHRTVTLIHIQPDFKPRHKLCAYAKSRNLGSPRLTFH